ncbi:hypothetical protein FKG94_20910 [Exilibacterium tricleocarpae]|uniref:Uncharacterized protein n=1 Tax=Exilibacterium tricleocarpae TaxID=2591008 RepID=A0A545T0N2_9GAMM|nr:hypothetical protein [Exilibacterium tricleocarpae]TQV70788.1 hypothetical protein FKG94_20910 [Exilibacterium tricleocarpae]
MAKIVIGGTLSEATGGKFANGAAYAAFSAIAQSAFTSNTRPDITAPQPRMVDTNGDGSFDTVALVNPNTEAASGRPYVFVEEVGGEQGGSVLTVDNTVAARRAFDALPRNTGTLFYASYYDLLQKDKARAFNRNAKIASGAVVVGGSAIAGVPALGGAVIGMTMHTVPRYFSGQDISAGGLLFSGTLGAVGGWATNSLVSASGGGLAAEIVWRTRILSGNVATNQIANDIFGF